MQIDSLLGSTPRSAPGRVAIDDGTRVITYGALPELIRREAEFLLASGGLRFGLLAENGCAWVMADLALHHLHRLNVPLPAYFTSTQQSHVVHDAGIDTLLSDRLLDTRQQWPGFRLLGRSPFSGLHLFRRTVSADSLQKVHSGVTKITYTSGSTGDPRGVCLTTATLNCVSRSLMNAVGPLAIGRHLCVMPLPTLLENLAGVHAGLRSGATCVVPPGTSTGMTYGCFDPQKFIATIVRTMPESLVLVPELLRVIVRAVQSGLRMPASLKFIAVGGAAVSKSLLDEAADADLPVYEGYGLSECGSVVCLNTPGALRRGSVGRPLPHVRVRVDAAGQIFVSGAVMSGYLGDPVQNGPLQIATGDLGEIDSDGYVYVRGRLRNTFITSFGRNVSPEWVEKELAQEHAIRYALAYGEAQPNVAALLNPADPALEAADLDRAVERANSRLPDYAQVRRWARMPVAPTVANGLLTANGRLRRERVLAEFGSLVRIAS
jgi:long-chain acyl-CoA synthetase